MIHWNPVAPASAVTPLEAGASRAGAPTSLAKRLLLSALLPILVSTALALAAWPFGEHPLNDDWQYARVVKTLDETGQIRIDVPIAPALVGQVLTAHPVVRGLGFSHRLLRGLTFALACSCLLALWLLLRHAGATPAMRQLALVLLAVNPLFAYLGLTFMTEIHGYAPVLWAAVLWFWGRARMDARSGSEGMPLVPWWVAVVCGALGGASFWTRQFSASVLPAILGASVVCAIVGREGLRLRRSAPRLATSFAFCLALALVYFAWANATGNDRSAFEVPLHQMAELDPPSWRIQPGVFIFYMTAFLYPALLFESCPVRVRRRGVLVGAALLLLMGSSLYLLRGADATAHPAAHLHASFPFLGNIVHDAGVGPVTLSDVYIYDMPLRPRWDPRVWKALQWALLALALSWVPTVGALLDALRRAVRERTSSPSLELVLFGLLLCFGSFFAVVQSYRLEVFDRYYFPCLLGLLLVVAVTRGRSPGKRGTARFLVALSPLAWFTLAGVHDHFRWQGARWELHERARAMGISSLSIDGGFEVQGWEAFDLIGEGARSPDCIGDCRCRGTWFCLDDSYQIGMNPLPGYEVIDSIQPDYWLTNGPPVLLNRRRPPREERVLSGPLGEEESGTGGT